MSIWRPKRAWPRHSSDGGLRESKLGLFDYMLKSFNLKSATDVLFVPVALNYDGCWSARAWLATDVSEAGGDLRGIGKDSTEGLFAVVAAERPVLAYYANAVAHLR
jgi:glycerol-3-phosphate O-acyltransferase